jgi:predicted DNA-binding antitoxin AbrB/MazE fold protein
MRSVEGILQNGVIQLNQPISGRDGQKVLIVFLQEKQEPMIPNSAWKDFAQILTQCQVSTGIPDLAHQHDYYLHGTPKRED